MDSYEESTLEWTLKRTLDGIQGGKSQFSDSTRLDWDSIRTLSGKHTDFHWFYKTNSDSEVDSGVDSYEESTLQWTLRRTLDGIKGGKSRFSDSTRLDWDSIRTLSGKHDGFHWFYNGVQTLEWTLEGTRMRTRRWSGL